MNRKRPVPVSSNTKGKSPSTPKKPTKMTKNGSPNKQSPRKLSPTVANKENKAEAPVTDIMAAPNMFSQLELARENGVVLQTYCFTKLLLLIQDKAIQFFNAVVKPNSGGVQQWVLIGSLPNKSLPRVEFLKDHAYYTISSSMQENGIVYCKLYQAEDIRDGCPITQLVASLYHCNADAGTVKECRMDLETIEGSVKDVNFCVLNDGSLFVCLAIVKEPGESYRTRIRKYSLGRWFNSCKEPMRFNFTTCPLEYLRSVHESASLVVGRNKHMVYLWNHKDNNFWHVTSLMDMKVTATPLHLVTEDSGVLYLVFERLTYFEVISTHLMSSFEENKIYRIYKFPEDFRRVIGVTTLPGVIGAAFSNGFCSWEKDTKNPPLEQRSECERIVLFLGTHNVLSVRQQSVRTIPFSVLTNEI